MEPSSRARIAVAALAAGACQSVVEIDPEVDPGDRLVVARVDALGLVDVAELTVAGDHGVVPAGARCSPKASLARRPQGRARASVGPMSEEEGVMRQREILRRMTPDQKLRAAMRLYWSARELKAAGVRAERPELDEDSVQEEVRRAFLLRVD